MYLSRQDNWHPSFNCYIEAVNEVFSKTPNSLNERNVSVWHTLW